MKLFKHLYSKKKYKIGDTEFVKDPLAFIRFLREENEEHVEFGKTALVAAGEEVVYPLIELLTNEKEDIKVRRSVGDVLGRIGEPSITPLLDVLKAQSFSNKSSGKTIGLAAAALGGIGNQAVDLLIQSLNSELRHVRFGVAIALIQTRDAKAIKAVRNAAELGDPQDRQMYRMVLGEH
jgi:HEAT repeat protein